MLDVKLGSLTVLAKSAVEARKLFAQLRRDGIALITNLRGREVDLDTLP